MKTEQITDLDAFEIQLIEDIRKLNDEDSKIIYDKIQQCIASNSDEKE